MRCERHPEKDAIGSCAHCGRGVCEDCRARPGDIVLCKECAAAGRTVPLPGAPEKPPVDRPVRFFPQPKGRPNHGYFLVGGSGAMIGGAMILVLAAMDRSGWNIYWNMGPHSVYAMDLFTIIYLMLVLPFFMLSMGCYGIYWNYGSLGGLVGTIGIMIAWPLTLLFHFIGMHAYLMALTMALFQISALSTWDYIPSRLISRRVLLLAQVVGLVGIGLLFLTFLINRQYVALLPVGAGLVLFAIFFWTAPVPLMLTPGPMGPPLPMKDVPKPDAPPRSHNRIP